METGPTEPSEPVESSENGASDAPAAAPAAPSAPLPDLEDPDLLINREVSWMAFNDRVLQLAEDKSIPLIERLKFCAIWESNLDEFFMVRVADLHDQVAASLPAGADGMKPVEQLEVIRELAIAQRERIESCFVGELLPKLEDEGIRIVTYEEASSEQRQEIDEIFERARNGEVEAAVATTQVATIRASAEVADRIILDGKESAGAGLGIWVVVFSVLGAAAAFVAAGVAGSSDRRQWLAGAIAMGCGLGVMGIATGWVGSLARASDANFTSGVGLLAAGISGSITFVAGRQVAHWFERSLVYAPSATSQPVASQEPIPEVIPA